MPKLLCGRFKNNDDSAEMLEQFDSIERAGIRWDVDDYGVSRIEVTVNRSDSYSAYDSFVNHQGQRLALYTDWGYAVISGWIMECKWLTANQVQYIAKGPHIRMMEIMVKRFYPTTTTFTDVIHNTLNYYTRIWDGDARNLFSNTSVTNGWVPNQPQGEYPKGIIKSVLRASSPDSQIVQFWMRDNPLKAGKLQKFKAYYQPRITEDITPDWVVYRRDLDNLSLSRSINEQTTVGRIWYGAVTGTITKNNPSGTEDNNAQFITDGVSPGDRITNTTVGGSASITAVVSETSIEHDPWKAKTTGTATGGSATTLLDDTLDLTTLGISTGDTLHNIADDSTGTITGITTNTLTISGGMSDSKINEDGERYEVLGGLSVGDSYIIAASNPNRFIEHQIPPVYWPVERAFYSRQADATQATQLAESVVTTSPVNIQSFSIRSDFIRDGNGAKWPLWEVIAKGGGYIQIVDLYPTPTAKLNNETVFYITALDYDHQSRQLRINVDTSDRKLDNKLKQALILDSTTIARRT